MGLAFSISCWVTSLLSAGFAALLILNRNKARDLAPVYLWSSFCLAVFIWSLGLGSMSFSASQRAADIWIQIHYAGAVFISPLFVHFALSLLRQHHRHRWFLWSNYGLALAGIGLSLTGYLVIATPKPPFRFYTAPSSFYNAFTLYFIGNIAFGHVKLVQEYFRSEGHRRRQLQYLLLGSTIGFAGGSTAFFPVYDIPIFPFGIFFAAVYVFIVGYAIFRYQLMDIRIFVRRAALLIGVYIALILIGGGIASALHLYHLGSYPQITGLVTTEVLILALTLSIGPFLYAYVVKQSSYFREHEMAGITHDLKSPIASIQSALEFLEDVKEGRPVGEREIKYIDMIRRNAARLEEAVNNLLTVFKIPTKKEAFELRPHDLNAILRSVIDEVKDGALAKGLRVEFQAATNGCMIRCDEAKIRQVISNLLSNAIKYTDTGFITTSINSNGADVRVVIQDTGRGIPPNELPRVFDRLYQGEAGRSAKGTGIGLTIAKTWVEAHGGEIHAESDGPGKGSRFWFTIPRYG